MVQCLPLQSVFSDYSYFIVNISWCLLLKIIKYSLREQRYNFKFKNNIRSLQHIALYRKSFVCLSVSLSVPLYVRRSILLSVLKSLYLSVRPSVSASDCSTISVWAWDDPLVCNADVQTVDLTDVILDRFDWIWNGLYFSWQKFPCWLSMNNLRELGLAPRLLV